MIKIIRMKRITVLFLSMILFVSFALYANGSSEGTSNTGTVQLSDAKTLIVYFTPANNDAVDFVSSATPRVGGVSSVEHVANIISSNVKADVAKIIIDEAYPLTYNATADRAKQEQSDNVKPAFSIDANPKDYDVIFVGYPIWWYHLPMIMDSFFDKYDFSGKAIIPFVLHAGSRDGGTFKEIKAHEPKASVLDGLAVRGDRAGGSEADVKKWLTGLGY